MDEKTLIQDALKGDESAFATIVSLHQRAVYGFLRARLIQPDDAEDLAQEVFLRFYQARARFDSSNLIRPWLMGIARNLLREHSRRWKHQRKKEVAWTELCLELDDVTQHREDVEDDTLLHLPGCLESLGPSARQAIDLRYRNNLRIAAIGEKLRRSEGAIKLLMFRARQALKHCLNGKMQNSSHV